MFASTDTVFTNFTSLEEASVTTTSSALTEPAVTAWLKVNAILLVLTAEAVTAANSTEGASGVSVALGPVVVSGAVVVVAGPVVVSGAVVVVAGPVVVSGAVVVAAGPVVVSGAVVVAAGPVVVSGAVVVVAGPVVVSGAVVVAEGACVVAAGLAAAFTVTLTATFLPVFLEVMVIVAVPALTGFKVFLKNGDYREIEKQEILCFKGLQSLLENRRHA